MLHFDTPVFKVIESIEELCRKDKALILDCLLDGLILYEHYKEVVCKQKPDIELINTVKTFQDTLKKTEAHKTEASPENPAASSTSETSPSGTL